MFGKKDKPIAVRKFSLAEFENLYKKIKEYLESGDDAYPVDESVEISIYSNNKITISADFKSYHIEDITLWIKPQTCRRTKSRGGLIRNDSK